MSLLDVTPSSLEMATTETLPIGIDMSNLLLAGETVTVPSATLQDTTNNKAVTGLANPSVAGNVVTQPIPGTLLTPGHEYRLVVSFQAASGKVWSQRLKIVCAF